MGVCVCLLTLYSLEYFHNFELLSKIAVQLSPNDIPFTLHVYVQIFAHFMMNPFTEHNIQPSAS